MNPDLDYLRIDQLNYEKEDTPWLKTINLAALRKKRMKLICNFIPIIFFGVLVQFLT